jgi:hypothetical protein
MHSVGMRIASVILLLATSILGQGLSTGGSNFAWYNLGQCNAGSYYAIANYDVDSATINAALQQMYANGQRSLRIPIYNIDGGERCTGALGTRGTGLDSTGGSVSPQCTQNLQALLSEIASVGFYNVIIGFFPLGSNSPSWNTMWPPNIPGYNGVPWYENPTYISLAQDNWNLI